MSFSINLMQNLSPKEALSKNTVSLGDISGTLKDSTSILNPVITFQGDISNFVNCNYMYISKFNRFYFVDNITSIKNNIFEISAHVDVLSTYQNQIRTNTAIIRRQENNWNLYLNDGSFKVYQNPMVLTKAFPNGFTHQEFVLAVAGS